MNKFILRLKMRSCFLQCALSLRYMDAALVMRARWRNLFYEILDPDDGGSMLIV